MSKALAKKQETQKMTFGMCMGTKAYQDMVASTIADPQRRAQFISAVTNAVSANPDLQLCDQKSVLSAALLGEGLKLTPSPQLGQYYIVPFKSKKNDYGKAAQFVLGYKGYLQLAIRSGYYTKINVMPIKDGELIRWDPLNEVIEIELIEDEDDREAAQTTGYYAMFEYQNGFRKAMFWRKSKMLGHADKFGSGFKKTSYKLISEGKIPKNQLWRYSSFWYTDFDAMACKTMLRQLISKWGVMSIEMQRAYEADSQLVMQDGTLEGPAADEAEPIAGEKADELSNDDSDAQAEVKADKPKQNLKKVSLDEV